MSIVNIDEPVLPAWAESSLMTVGGRSELLYVYKGKDGKTLSKFVSPEDVARAYSKLTYDTGDIPAGIMRMGAGPNGWWGILRTEPQLVTMSFLDEDPITVPIPGTVLLGVGKNYRIFAEKAGKLYHAPFDNVYPDGRICWGNNSVPTVKKAADLQKTWGLFWLSPFTHRNDVSGGNMTYRGVYEALARTKAKKYTAKLKDSKITIAQLVKIATGNRENLDD